MANGVLQTAWNYYKDKEDTVINGNSIQVIENSKTVTYRNDEQNDRRGGRVSG